MVQTVAQAVIQDFIERDTEWIAEIIEKYPEQIPIPVLAEKVWMRSGYHQGKS